MYIASPQIRSSKADESIHDFESPTLIAVSSTRLGAECVEHLTYMYTVYIFKSNTIILIIFAYMCLWHSFSANQVSWENQKASSVKQMTFFKVV